MRKASILLLVSLLSLSASQLRADIAAIHASALPQETAVLAALDDAKQLEPYSHFWSSEWNFPIAKDEVAKRLSKDLTSLARSVNKHQDNIELLLLTGLVARYAYNVDVGNSLETAMTVLNRAQTLDSEDIRASWFLDALQCQTLQTIPGAEGFLSLEASRPWDQLPIAFWDDYAECAYVNGMPAHVLRAGDHIRRLNAPESERRTFILDLNDKHYFPYDPGRKYKPTEVWQGENAGEDVVLTSRLCGVRLHARAVWRVDRLELSGGTCFADFGTGPYPGTVHDLFPSVMLLVQQPEEGESLESYSKKFLKDGTFEPDPALRCPVAHCIALKGIQTGMYKEDGGGRGRILFFERDQPEFPGIVFESPDGPTKPDAGSDSVVYHPEPTTQRIPGKLYYLVMLDTAASIEEPALKDFDFFLQNLAVE
jgi:hypothetical protein